MDPDDKNNDTMLRWGNIMERLGITELPDEMAFNEDTGQHPNALIFDVSTPKDHVDPSKELEAFLDGFKRSLTLQQIKNISAVINKFRTTNKPNMLIYSTLYEVLTARQKLVDDHLLRHLRDRALPRLICDGTFIRNFADLNKPDVFKFKIDPFHESFYDMLPPAIEESEIGSLQRKLAALESQSNRAKGNKARLMHLQIISLKKQIRKLGGK